MYWLHVLAVLTAIYDHHQHASAPVLYHLYAIHHAIGFLQSGITSESPATRGAARHLLWWLVTHRLAPVNW